MIKILLSRKLGEMRMSQKALAEATGIRPNTIGEIYNELSERISLDHLDKICEVLGCQPGELIVWEPDKQPKH